MTALPGDTDKYGNESASPVVGAFHATLHEIVRQRFEESGKSWKEFVLGDADSEISSTRRYSRSAAPISLRR